MAYLLLAALLASVVNFFMRRNFEKGGTAGAFLSLYFASSFVLALFIYSELFVTPISPVMIGLGCLTGFLNFAMMGLTAKTLQLGPPGLTFTFQNASSIVPGILMFLLFGPAFGFDMSLWLCLGFVLILLGLIVATHTVSKENPRASSEREVLVEKKVNLSKWLFCAISMLMVQGIILSIFQWRVLLLNEPTSNHWLIPWCCQKEEEIWFMPTFFLVPAVLQALTYWRTEKRKFTVSEWFYGPIAGVFNCFAMLLLLLVTKTGSSLDKAMEFPLFTVAVILFCNLWGWKIYKEKVNWIGITLCILGVMMGFISKTSG